jgi:hypothetical protein
VFAAAGAACALTAALVGVVVGMVMTVEMVMLMGMGMVVAVGMLMGVGMGVAVVGVLVGMGVGVVKGMTAGNMIVMDMHSSSSFWGFFSIIAGKRPGVKAFIFGKFPGNIPLWGLRYGEKESIMSPNDFWRKRGAPPV